MDMQTVTPVPGVPAFVEGVTNLRDQIITVMDLRKRLGLPDKSIANEKIIIIDLGTSTLDESILGVGKQGNHLTIILDIAKTISRVQNTA